MRALLATLAALLLSGCAEVDESWDFDGKGGGEYGLVLRYDADLLRRLTGILGEATVERMRGREFPLRADEVRATLEGLPGLEVLRLEEEVEAGGMRHIEVRLRFAKVADLLRWEVLARRPYAASIETRGEGDGAERFCRLVMRPFQEVPVLDPLARLARDLDEPPAGLADAAGERADPGPLARLGIAERDAAVVADLLRPALAGVRLAVRVKVPGAVEERLGRGVAADGATRFAFGFEDLRAPETDRAVGLVWRLRSLDEAPVASQIGDAPAAGAGGG